jgi:hypothetical protein
MSIMAVSAIVSRDSDPAQQQNGPALNMRSLQRALAAGNLAGAQQAFSVLKNNLQAVSPQLNGMRSADADPQATVRSDVDALQKALASGQLPAAEQAFTQLQQDLQQIKAAQNSPEALQVGPSASALPKPDDEQEPVGLSSANDESTTPKAIDVYA